MTSPRKKPGWAFWICGAVLVMLAYALSFGPCTWLARHQLIADDLLPLIWRFYEPLEWIIEHSPTPIHELFWWYARLWRGN